MGGEGSVHQFVHFFFEPIEYKVMANSILILLKQQNYFRSPQLDCFLKKQTCVPSYSNIRHSIMKMFARYRVVSIGDTSV